MYHLWITDYFSRQLYDTWGEKKLVFSHSECKFEVQKRVSMFIKKVSHFLVKMIK